MHFLKRHRQAKRKNTIYNSRTVSDVLIPTFWARTVLILTTFFLPDSPLSQAISLRNRKAARK